jgi:hypothetical protein
MIKGLVYVLGVLLLLSGVALLLPQVRRSLREGWDEGYAKGYAKGFKVVSQGIVGRSAEAVGRQAARMTLPDRR